MSTVRLRHLKESQGLQGWHENVKIATANAPDLVSRHGRFVEPRPVPRKQSTPSSCLPQKRSLHIRKSLENCIQLCPTSWRSCKGPKLFLLAVARRQVPRIGQCDIVTRSMWVACAGSRCTSNTTTNDGEDSISHQADALETPTTSLASLRCNFEHLHGLVSIQVFGRHSPGRRPIVFWGQTAAQHSLDRQIVSAAGTGDTGGDFNGSERCSVTNIIVLSSVEKFQGPKSVLVYIQLVLYFSVFAKSRMHGRKLQHRLTTWFAAQYSTL